MTRPTLAPPSPRPKAVAVAAFVVGGIVYAVLRDETGVMHVFQERSRLETLSHSVSDLREENNLLRAEIKALREDPRAVERVAREDLGLAKKDETVFILEAEPSEPIR